MFIENNFFVSQNLSLYAVLADFFSYTLHNMVILQKNASILRSSSPEVFLLRL